MWLGHTAGAEKLAAELDKTFPLDTLVHMYWLPTIRAAVALHRKDPNRAIELLKVAGTVELSTPTGDLTVFLCPVYLRGEAICRSTTAKERQRNFRSSSNTAEYS